MSIYRHALVLVVLLSSAAGTRAQAGGEGVNLRRLGQAVAAISGGELQRAESLLNSVLAVAPRDADALNLLGVVRARQGRGADAERLFRRALDAQPAHLGAHVNLGELLI